MKSAFAAFTAEAERLRAFLSRANAETRFFAAIIETDATFQAKYADAISTLVSTATNNRRYGYFLSIIVMYGALERFVEDACQEFVTELGKQCDTFDQLPEAIQASHTALSIEHLSLLQNGRMQAKSEIPVIIEQVSACLRGMKPFEINAKAFTIRSGNMHFDRVRTIFTGLGIAFSPKRVASAAGYKSRYEELYGTKLDLTSADALRRVFFRIDELVDVRNKIAHGVIDTDQIEEIALIYERLTDLENFVIGLTAILEQEILLFCHSKGRMRALGPLIDVFNKSIVCIEVEGSVTVGDIIAVLTEDPTDPIRYGPILSIQVDNVDLTTINGGPGVNVGMKVNFRAKDNGDYFALPDDVRRLMRAG